MLKIQINLRTISQNLATVKKKLPPQTKICAVVKANAYGFGDALISQHIVDEVDYFGVASVWEGKRLRTANIKKDILVFGVCDDMETAVANNLIITINSLNELQKINEEITEINLPDELQKINKQKITNKKIRIHIGIDTGMNRFGVKKYSEFQKIIAALKNNNNISVEGLYTHFAFETNNLPEVKAQIEKFGKFVKLFKKYFPFGIIHGASSGTIDYPPAIYDMVRVGKALYGGIDGTDTAVTVQSKIVAVKQLRAGERVSYNGEFVATKPTVIGIVAGGYADGIDMRFSGHSFVLVDNNFCQIVARNCMDCFAIILPHNKNMIGKTVWIISARNGQTLMDIYHKTNIIVCDILCGIKHTRAEVTIEDCNEQGRVGAL
ncbi:MAG: alanine racemase [Christensenellaceae bacterium]|jgi:alanine racemase|nr:alanine racemase [Christensenellaceae bacterium]